MTMNEIKKVEERVRKENEETLKKLPRIKEEAIKEGGEEYAECVVSTVLKIMKDYNDIVEKLKKRKYIYRLSLGDQLSIERFTINQ